MSKSTRFLFVALVLGLGWAIRGHFGHERGAAWAGLLATLAVLLVSNRKDWMKRAPALVALGAIGWGVGGMMSYGIVVGYCRSVSFVNSTYGYAMLAIIGALWGFIGGGLFGLGLESSEKNKPKWPNLIVEMFTGGFLIWAFFIGKMEWFMTPPRHETWAACLGAAIALSWFLYRNKFPRALRVAAYSALGAGFGFAFGNFLQGLGSISGIAYNWWNVMEFTLGFFGGLGMVYAVITREWPKSIPPSKTANWISLTFIFIFIPLMIYFNSMSGERFVDLAKTLNILDAQQYASTQMLFAGLTLIPFFLIAVFIWNRFYSHPKKLKQIGIPALLLTTTIHYTLLSYIQKGMFYHPFSFKYSDSLYIFIVAIMFFMWYYLLRKNKELPKENAINETWKRWALFLGSLLAIIILFGLISSSINTGLPGAHNRF